MLIWLLGFCIFLLSVTLHELAHGFIAANLGDDTALKSGRISLNPLKHIDIFWTILLPVSLFIATGGRFVIGQAKPVPVDFRKLRPQRIGMIGVALAGPGANFLLAYLFSLIYKHTAWIPILVVGVYLNLALGVFNLVPIPPLDGSRVLSGLMPSKAAKYYALLEPYGFIIVLVLVYLGAIGKLVIPSINLFCTWLSVPRI